MKGIFKLVFCLFAATLLITATAPKTAITSENKPPGIEQAINPVNSIECVEYAYLLNYETPCIECHSATLETEKQFVKSESENPADNDNFILRSWRQKNNSLYSSISPVKDKGIIKCRSFEC